MNKMKLIPNLLVSLTAILGVSNAISHGNEAHGPVTFSEADFEQMPWGIGALASKAQRTVNVTLTDNMRFDPASLTVKQGETVRFVVKNEGQIMHEFVIGTIEANQEHAELMKRFPNMEHEAPYMAHVAPGKTKEIVWTFNQPGEFQFACLIAGHFDAGMVGAIQVASSLEDKP